MPYVVCAKWTAKEGEEEKVWEAAQQWIGPTRQEPGNLMYIPHRDPENPRVFLVYEQYRDKAAFEEHGASDHFQSIGAGELFGLMEERERTFYETL